MSWRDYRHAWSRFLIFLECHWILTSSTSVFLSENGGFWRHLWRLFESLTGGNHVWVNDLMSNLHLISMNNPWIKSFLRSLFGQNPAEVVLTLTHELVVPYLFIRILIASFALLLCMSVHYWQFWLERLTYGRFMLVNRGRYLNLGLTAVVCLPWLFLQKSWACPNSRYFRPIFETQIAYLLAHTRVNLGLVTASPGSIALTFFFVNVLVL